MKAELSPIEEAVLKKLLDGDLLLLVQLRRQIEICRVVKRELTGFGFYTTLIVPDSIPRASGVNIKFGDVVGEIPGLTSGAGFLIYLKDGVLDMLEGYSYDEPWPSSIKSFRLKYMSGVERDWKALSEILCIKA